MVGEEDLHKRLPRKVLAALEQSVAAHNTAIADLAGQSPSYVVECTKTIEQSLHACFLAAAGTARHSDHSRREWEAMQANTEFINEILETIHEQTIKMKQPGSVSTERLAAMRELDLLPTEQHVHIKE